MSLAGISVKRYVFAAMLNLLIVLFGIVAYDRIGVERLPNIDLAKVSVLTRLDGANPEVIAFDVERVVFDDAESSGWELPLDAVRVQIYFRGEDEKSRELKYFVEGMTRLRNNQGTE